MIIKNAWKNLGRNLGNTLMLGAILCFILFMTTCAISVHKEAKTMVQQQKEAIGAQVVITRNDEKMEQALGNAADLSNYQAISLTQMEAFQTSSYLKGSNIYASTLVHANIHAIKGSGFGNSANQENGALPSPTERTMLSPNAMIIASNDAHINHDFQQGKREIIEGRTYEKANEVVIGEQLAKANQLKLNDTISASFIDYMGGNHLGDINLKIVGIFKDHTINSDGNLGAINQNNDLFVSLETLSSATVATSQNGDLSVEGTFLLKDPKELPALEREFHAKGMPAYYELQVNQSAYDAAVAPLESIENFTQVATIAILIIGAGLLVAVSIFTMRERIYELGVLRAMGMKKKKIVGMLCTEMLLLTLFCSLFAMSAANNSVQPIAEYLMEKESQTITQPKDVNQQFLSGSEQEVPTLSASLSKESVAMSVGIAMILAVIGSGVGVLYCVKQEPMRILMERNG